MFNLLGSYLRDTTHGLQAVNSETEQSTLV